MNLENWQIKRYNTDLVWNIRENESEIHQAEFVTANFIIGSEGVENIITKVLKSGAHYVSVAVCEQEEHTTVEEVVWHFQKNGLDLIFMRDFRDERGRAAVRLDFERLKQRRHIAHAHVEDQHDTELDI